MTREKETFFSINQLQIKQLLKGKQCSLPILSSLAWNYLRVPTGGAGVERSFSLLKQLESPQRLTMSNETFKDSLFCFCISKYFSLLQ